MPSKKANPEAASEGAGLDTSSDLLAELNEVAEAAAEAPAPERAELAGGTVLETNTVYEDRTTNPQAERDVEYEVEEEKLDNGTVLTNVLGVKAE